MVKIRPLAPASYRRCCVVEQFGVDVDVFTMQPVSLPEVCSPIPQCRVGFLKPICGLSV